MHYDEQSEGKYIQFIFEKSFYMLKCDIHNKYSVYREIQGKNMKLSFFNLNFD